MYETMLIKNKLVDFEELNQCEVNSVEEAVLLMKILSSKGKKYTMNYDICMAGEYWVFNK